MDTISLINLFFLPLGLGLLGFIEPCTIGASLLAVKYLEDEPGWRKARYMLIFSLVRALLIGMLGLLAALSAAASSSFSRAFGLSWGWFTPGSESSI